MPVENQITTLSVVKIAIKFSPCAYIATALFNEGYAAVFEIMDVLEIKIEPQCKQYADSYDAKGIKQASLRRAKEAHAARIMNQIQEQEFFEESEGFLYGPRIAD